MDDRAQVAFEYIAVIAVLIMIAAIVMFFVGSIFGIRSGLKGNIGIYSNKTAELLGG